MKTACNLLPSQLKDVPLVNYQCCAKLANSKKPGSSTYEKRWCSSNSWNSFDRYKFAVLIATLLVVLITCFAISIVYLNLNPGALDNREYYVVQKPPLESRLPEGDAGESSVKTDQPLYDDMLRAFHREIYSLLPEADRIRLKRETTPEISLCQQNIEHCRSVLDSMNLIVNIVNNSMPHLQALSKNLTSDVPNAKSDLRDLLACLECKRIQEDAKKIPDESRPGFNDNHDSSDDHFEAAEINKANAVIRLLDDYESMKDHENLKATTPDNQELEIHEEKENSEDLNSIETSHDKSSVKNVDHIESGNQQDEQSLKKINASLLFKKHPDTDLHKSHFTEGEAHLNSSSIGNEKDDPFGAEISSTAASATLKTTDTTSDSNAPDISMNKTEWIAITANVTAKPELKNVIEITSNHSVHPSVHPSKQGQKEDETKVHTEGSGEPRRSEYNGNTARIVSNENFQAKVNAETAQVFVPTAETIKSSQQLQLTPTMSWMPYQVCFYGPPAGPVKQSFPGQTNYPVTSPGSFYPVSMPQQRGPQFPNQPNQPGQPNYVQVQTQSVQFMPMQPYPGNPVFTPGHRVGPTGPGIQNYPGFQGQQSSATGTSGSARSPYYCTFIPAPTFQFPAIPGVTEYQRSSNDNNLDEQRSVVIDKGYNYCPPRSVPCSSDGKCILKTQWCDGQVDCNDASDEARCSCRDRISKDRLCDGYFDCPHGEDELGCLGCPRKSFSCDDWTKRYTADNCVPLSQRCDGVRQCANGKDEMDCNILTPTYIEGKDIFTIGFVEGYLHKNFGGKWFPVCTPTASWAIDACTSEIGPTMQGIPDIKIHAIPDNTYRGPYLAEVNGKIETVQSCSNTAVYVTCPPISCGTRVFSRQDSSSSYNRFAENFYEQHSSDKDNNTNSDTHSEVNNSIDENAQTGNSSEDDENDSLVGSQLRVVGGRASQPKAWPSLIAIYKDGNFHCGGVILNELWVLTAAHCLDGYQGHYYEVQAGMLRRYSFSPMSQSRKAKYVIMHPRYDSKDMINDIGMIMLDEPLRFNRWVRPICLPSENIGGFMWRRHPLPKTICKAIGWGSTRERGPDPDHLREVEVPILPFCKYITDQNEASICAGYQEGGRDACQGDSGGPLMCKSPLSDLQWYVAGLISHGEGCARPNEPGAYTRVSYFVDWIQETASGQTIPVGKIPLDRCPGFSCEGGLGKCLPIEKKCDRNVDCLDAEDEMNCLVSRPEYILFRNSNSDAKYNTSEKEEKSILNKFANIIVPDTTDIESSTTTAKPETIELNVTLSETTETENTMSTTPAGLEDDKNIEARVNAIFTCSKLLQSISITKVCDKVYDCEDGTDETNCTCKDYLTNLKPSAICDGYLDCADKTDEENCEICQDDEFLCRRSQTCVPSFKKCDGVYDCPLREDEEDCFALTNGEQVYLDANNRPILNIHGVLTRYSNGIWKPTCHRPVIHRNQSTANIIAQNMCEYFGFAGFEASYKVVVKDRELEMVEWDAGNVTGPEYMTIEGPENEEDNTCPGLYIHCRPVPSSTLNRHLVVDPRTGNRSYLWPWLAAIFVDGFYRCSAILLGTDWLLSSTKCLANISLDANYTTAVLGYSPSYLYVDGPHQQVSIIDDIKEIKDSSSSLLHMKSKVNLTRYIQPLFLEKKIYPPVANDICVAVGTDEEYQTKSVFLKPVLENCLSCKRCFVNASLPECSGNESAWSGNVFCRGKKGWYPAASFYQENGTCSFRNAQSLSSIDYINPYLTQAMEEGITSWKEPPCDGFRCTVGNCIPHNELCDGISNCRDALDESPEICNEIAVSCENSVDGCKCAKSEMRCGNGKCVEKSAFCDGKVDCYDGTDEPINCTCAAYLRLTAPERVCDGIRNCLDKTDEAPDLCFCKETSFRCNTSSENNSCIPQDFVCDGYNDCPSGDDEIPCLMLANSSKNRFGSGEIIRRSYGVWHSECLQNPIQSEEEATRLCKKVGFTSGKINNETRVLNDTLVPYRDNFYMVKLNQWTWITMRDDKPLMSLIKPTNTCNRPFVDCV